MSVTSRRNIDTSIVAAILFVVTLAIFKSQVFLPLDHRLNDWFLLNQAPNVIPEPSIIVIDIDDYSIEAMKSVVGRWSWPRSVYAEMFEQLSVIKPKAIVVDVLFAEHDIYRPDDDAYFREVVSEMHNVFFASLLLNTDETSGTANSGGNLVSEIALSTSISPTENARKVARGHFVTPNVVGVEAAKVGLINSSPDKDDTLRKYHLFRNYQGWQLNSLPLVVSQAIGTEITQDSSIILSWPKGSQRPYKTVSFVNVYRAVVENDIQTLAQFSNKVILLGSSAAGLFDAQHTPIHPELPGVYILAVAIDNLLNDSFISLADNTLFITAFILVFIVLHLVYAMLDCYTKQVLAGILVFTVASAFAVVWSYWLLTQLQQLFVVTPILCWLLVLVTLSVVHGYLEYSQRQFALSVFGRFLDPTMVNSLYQEGQLEISQLNKKSKVTVMFSDIRNFTSLSEKHQADEVLAILNQYLTHQVAVIFKHHGTLDKFIGDCIMAFWGAPKVDEHQELNALEAAMAMSDFIDAFRKELPEHLRDFDIGIGIHTGQAIVGMVGADLRVDYTVIGDTVNVASRIEGLTKNVSRILVSKTTMEAAKKQFLFEFVGKFEVKGRANQVELYRPTGRRK